MLISNQDKILHIATELSNVITILHLIRESHNEIIDKVRRIRAISIKSCANELKKMNEALLIADSKTQQILSLTQCKTQVNYAKDSTLAENRHKLRNIEFLSESKYNNKS